MDREQDARRTAWSLGRIRRSWALQRKRWASRAFEGAPHLLKKFEAFESAIEIGKTRLKAPNGTVFLVQDWGEDPSNEPCLILRIDGNSHPIAAEIAMHYELLP